MFETLLSRIRNRYVINGLGGTLKKAIEIVWRTCHDAALNEYFQITSAGTFILDGAHYHYFRHTYNRAFENERTVEVPIALAMITRARGKRILEIGNVLSHYQSGLDHDVLDKYEEAPGVINEDVITYCPLHRYDIIVSVSTMEHVGWDEDVKDPPRLLFGLRNLINYCLAPKGALLVTAPIGYNIYLDQWIRKGKLPFSKILYLERISEHNTWRETSREKALRTTYGGKFPNANAVMIGIYHANL